MAVGYRSSVFEKTYCHAPMVRGMTVQDLLQTLQFEVLGAVLL